jgi:O-antigen/teichoic acid export membrane protein
MLIISPFIYHFWLKDKVIIPFDVSICVAIFIISSILANLYSYMLNGMGKIKLQLRFSNTCIFINIPFAWILGEMWGIVGVITPSIIMNIVASFLYAVQVRKILNGTAKGIWNK